ncbi:MAG: hypothetical protein DRJ55_06605 [Thermoprotei archaeon]|nr:MAG: hypothetical protein DRJ55_06605 [Thermoprotei archaeon]
MKNGISSSYEGRTITIYRLHSVRKFIQIYVKVDLPPEILQAYKKRYIKPSIKVLKPIIKEKYRLIIKGLVKIKFKIANKKYPQIYLTYEDNIHAQEALNIMQSLALNPSISKGKRGRVILIYRLKDIRLFLDEIIDQSKIPPKFKQVCEQALESPFSISVNEKRLMERPELWRIIGLILGDNDMELNTFSNTNTKLLELFRQLATKLFPEEVVKTFHRKPKPHKKICYVIRIKGLPGQVVAKIAANAHKIVPDLKGELFWELVTGLYEADGSVSVRYPSKSYRKPYPDISIRLAPYQDELAKAIRKRLLAEGIDTSVRPHSSTLEIRITNQLGFKIFFTKANPIIKNPRHPESFRNTRTKPKAAKILYEIWKRVQERAFDEEDEYFT